MCYIVTMHMGKATRIFRGVAIGCLNSKYACVYISVFLTLFEYSVPSYLLVCQCLHFCAYISVPSLLYCYRELMHIVFVHYLEVKVNSCFFCAVTSSFLVICIRKLILLL